MYLFFVVKSNNELIFIKTLPNIPITYPANLPTDVLGNLPTNISTKKDCLCKNQFLTHQKLIDKDLTIKNKIINSGVLSIQIEGITPHEPKILPRSWRKVRDKYFSKVKVLSTLGKKH